MLHDCIPSGNPFPQTTCPQIHEIVCMLGENTPQNCTHEYPPCFNRDLHVFHMNTTSLAPKDNITNELYKCVWHESLILSLLCSLKRFASALPSGSKEEIKLILAARSYQNELIVCNGSRWLDFACWSF